MSVRDSSAFSDTLYSLLYPDGIENNWWNWARNRVILYYMNKFRQEPLLDVGCGRGVVTCFLKSHGWNVEGIELGNTTPLCEGNFYYGRDIFSLPEEKRQQFRSVSLFDVIEHIDDPVVFLAEIRRFFRSLKYVYITVPARMELWSRFDDDVGHKRRYTLKSLSEHADLSGYSVVFSRYFFHSLYLPIMLLKSRRSAKMSVPRSSLFLLLHRLVGFFFFVEGIILPGKIPGSSIFAIFEPKKF